MEKRSTLENHWLALLDYLSSGRFRHLGLQAARLADAPQVLDLSDPVLSVSPPIEPLPSDPFEQAWLVAEAFAKSVHSGLGRHCTPRAVARQLAGDGLTESRGSIIIDPAVGGGALLLAAAEVMNDRSGGVDFDNLIGLDVDPTSIAASQAVLWIAAGQPDRPVGHFEMRDFVGQGLPRELIDKKAGLLIANPPWGVTPDKEALDLWKARVGGSVTGLLRGEVNSFTLFLLEGLLCTPFTCAFLTPFDWMYHRSQTDLRKALADIQRLKQVFILRKRVFKAAPDMIGALTIWTDRSHTRPISIRRTGFRTAVPFSTPLPVDTEIEIHREDWVQMPFCIVPLLRSRRFAGFARRFMNLQPKMSDPLTSRTRRLLHIGDGAYKTHVSPSIVDSDQQGIPILCRAAQIGRYRLDPPGDRLSLAGIDRLSDTERRRFGSPKLILHALKKPSAPWRVSAAIHRAQREPLVLTNNFLVVVAQSYPGDLLYPLALLNSRLYNRMYTEHFPGVNIEAYTVGLLPLPWPPVQSRSEPPDEDADLLAWLGWARDTSGPPGHLGYPVYEWLCRAAARLQSSSGSDRRLDERVEAVVAGLFRLDPEELTILLENDNPRRVADCHSGGDENSTPTRISE